jgi:hypothetical protein
MEQTEKARQEHHELREEAPWEVFAMLPSFPNEQIGIALSGSKLGIRAADRRGCQRNAEKPSPHCILVTAWGVGYLPEHQITN